jgi:hypothetical protein
MLTTSCGEDDKGIKLTDFTLSPTEIKKPVGEIQKVTATSVPSDATDVVYSWTSANESVATVNAEGIVRITGVGTTTVTATSGAISKTVQVEGTISAITLKDADGQISGTYPYTGAPITFTLTASTEPPASGVKPEWSSNVDHVAVVPADDGMSATVTIFGVGAAAVTATVDGITATYNIATESVLNDAKGYWTFEDPSNYGKATRGTDLKIIGDGGVLAAEGPSADKAAIIAAGQMDGFKWDPHNISGQGLTDFTMLFDLSVPIEPDRRYYPLWWNDVAHSCSFYIRPRDKQFTFCVAGSNDAHYGGDLIEDPTAAPWVRVVITYSYDPEMPDKRVLWMYGDGQVLNDAGEPKLKDFKPEQDLFADRPIYFLTGSPDGPAAPGPDKDGDYNPFKVSTIAVWDRVLTPEEVASLGGVSK